MSRRSTAHRTGRSLAILVASTLALAACGGGGEVDYDDSDSGPAETTPIDLVDLTFQPITAGKLTVCASPAANTGDPFRFKDPAGKWGGLEIDLAIAIAIRYGLVVEVTERPADDIRVAPGAGTCDIAAASLTIDPEAGGDVVFSDKYFDVYQSLLVREADAETLTTLESLAGKKVGVLRGAAEAFIADNAPDLAVEAFADIVALHAALDSGRIDAVVAEFSANAFRAKSKGGTVVSLTFEDRGSTEYAFALAPESQELLLAVNESLNEFNSTGVYQEIYDKYFTITTGE